MHIVYFNITIKYQQSNICLDTNQFYLSKIYHTISKVSLYYPFKHFNIQVFSVIISLYTPMYSLTCVQKGYMVINLIDWC